MARKYAQSDGDSVMEELIGIHLDLKYHMPRKDYLLSWLRRLPGYGINAILLEDEAEVLAVFARLKHTSARILKFFLTDEGDRTALSDEIEAQKNVVANAIRQCWESVGAERMMRVYWESLSQALKA